MMYVIKFYITSISTMNFYQLYTFGMSITTTKITAFDINPMLKDTFNSFNNTKNFLLSLGYYASDPPRKSLRCSACIMYASPKLSHLRWHTAYMYSYDSGSFSWTSDYFQQYGVGSNDGELLLYIFILYNVTYYSTAHMGWRWSY